MNKTNKEKDLTIAGKTISVNLGSGYFYEFFEEATGVDLVKNGVIEDDVKSKKVFKYLQGFVYAGSKAYDSIREKENDMTLDKAKKMVYSMDESEMMNLFLECIALMSGLKVDDLKNVKTQAGKRKKL